MARMIMKNGVRTWEIQVEGQEVTKFYPEYRKKDISGTEMWYKFNPILGTYEPNLTGMEPSMEEEPIGTYGMRWIDWMKNYHSHLVAEMRMNNNFLTVARSVDKEAWEHRAILDRDYEQMHPRPTEYEDVVSWERTRTYYSDNTVMRETVLMAVTQP
jgi:hypothetical protein